MRYKKYSVIKEYNLLLITTFTKLEKRCPMLKLFLETELSTRCKNKLSDGYAPTKRL